MRIKNYFKKSTTVALLLFAAAASSFAQNMPAPREEKLLNGMKLLVWSDAKAAKTTVKLRIHSGSAFDPQTREGVMALLADILFPTQTAKEYFEEDLGGSLEITSNYDYIQINATGDNDKILEILEALATAISKPQIDKDTTARVKAAKLEKVKELEKDPAYIADQAVAKRLFGNFPYGRPQLGTTESLSKIDFADLMLARQKFLTADNATLAVSGNVKSDFIYRAARRLFGGWEKADRKVPSTFTAPDVPNEAIFRIESPTEFFYAMRFAFRGLARNDQDYFASQIFVDILRNRLFELINPSYKNTFSVRQETHVLPGYIVIGFTRSMIDDAKTEERTVFADKQTSFRAVIKKAVGDEEFARSKTTILNDLSRRSIDEIWLDVGTFKLIPVKDEFKKANEIPLSDVQRVQENLTKNPMVSVLVDDSEPTLVKPKTNN